MKALISHVQPTLLNAPSKSVCWGGRGVAQVQGKHSHRCARQGRCLQDSRPVQFKALAAAHAASAGPSNALLIATLRLPSPQTRIRLHVPVTKSASAASRRGGGAGLRLEGGWDSSETALCCGLNGCFVQPGARPHERSGPVIPSCDKLRLPGRRSNSGCQLYHRAGPRTTCGRLGDAGKQLEMSLDVRRPLDALHRTGNPALPINEGGKAVKRWNEPREQTQSF